MSVSPYSVLMAVLWFSVAALVGSITLRRAHKHGLTLIAAIYIFALLRGIFPVDFSESIVIRSYKIYPLLINVLTAPIYGRITIGWCLIALWGGGATVHLYRFLLKLIQQVRFLRTAQCSVPDSRLFMLLDEVCSEFGYRGQYKLVMPQTVSTVQQAGFLHLNILLPVDVTSFSEEDIRNIFRHELCHFLGGDLWIKAGIEIAGCFLWWNPIMPLLNHSVVQLLELFCDKRACKERSSAGQLEYVETLLRFIKSSVADSDGLTLSYLGNADDAKIKQRFQLMLQDKPSMRSQFRFLGSCLICFMLFIASYFVIFQPASFPDPLEDGFSITTLTSDNAYILQTQDGALIVYYNNAPYGTPISEDMLKKEPLSNLPILSERDD